MRVSRSEGTRTGGSPTELVQTRTTSHSVASSAERTRATPGGGARDAHILPGASSAQSSSERAAAYRTACRFFRGFERIPAAVLESVHGFPEAFLDRTGRLRLADREQIAHAVTGDPFEAFGGDEHGIAGEPALEAAQVDPEQATRTQQRNAAIADFVRTVLERWRPLRFEDVEPMFEVGFDVAAVREAAELALDFHVIHRLTSALAVTVAATFAVVPRSPAARANRRERVSRARTPLDDDEDQALIILPPAPEPRARRAGAF